MWKIPKTIDRVSFYRTALFAMLPSLPLLLSSLARLLLGRLHVAQHGKIRVTLLHRLQLQIQGTLRGSQKRHIRFDARLISAI